MAGTGGSLLAAVLVLVSSGFHCSSPPPACPQSCTCQRAPLLNCSSSGLSVVPQNIQDSVNELDLSHNLLESVTLHQPRRNLRIVWLGNNNITGLSLCVERNRGSNYVRRTHRMRPWGRRGCISWAPTLQLLSVERNQLEQLPEGLEGSESLQVLQLSFNRISALRPAELSRLRQLKELHLQHNLIASLHPQMFQDLAQLQVLDLSFNMLTSLHPLMYLSLRNIGADVRLSGNRWQCDCSMRSLRRRMAYDSSRGVQAMSVVCASPSILSGRDLLQVEEDDLNCFSTEIRPERHQDVTVYSGSEILLSCSAQDSVWWTPSGQASVNQPQAGLLINDITETDTGLYVCMSEKHKVVSVFNLQISKIEDARRKTRSLPRTGGQIIPRVTANRSGQDRNQKATQSDLALAVCLSVLFSFLIAFILGVLARPYIDVLWRRVTKRKKPSVTASVSSVEQRQYDNHAYADVEEPDMTGAHMERRVTFTTVDIRESNVIYYDTVAAGDQESINSGAAIECGAAEAERDKCSAGDSGSESSLQQNSSENSHTNGKDLSGVTDASRTHKIEFEHIPDPDELEKRRSSSSSSDSCMSNKALNEDQVTHRDRSTPKSPQLAEGSVQQRDDFSTRHIEVQQISIEGAGQIPGFSTEPFADWSPHTNNTDLWPETGEQFEFSDSVRSTSTRSSSVRGSFNDSKLIVAPTSDKLERDDELSSSSYVSEDEHTEYTVNSDQEEDIERSQSEYRYDTQSPALRPKHSFSSHSSDSDGENYKVKELDKAEGEDKSICVSDTLSSSIAAGKWDTREKVKPMPRTKWRVAISGVTNQSKSLDTGAPSPPAAHASSSSSESEEDSTTLKVEKRESENEGIKINQPQTLSANQDNQPKGHFVINDPLSASQSSSSDESMNETLELTQKQQQMKQDQDETPDNKQRPTPNTRWPVLDLEHTTSVKKRLDIKVPSPDSDSSSSSDSEDEATKYIKKEEQVKTQIARPPSKVTPTVSDDPNTKWPTLDLDHVPQIKRHLDIKAPSPPPDSSSNKETVEEKFAQIKKHEQGDVHVSRLPFQEPHAGSHDPQRRQPESSSSSDSENEAPGHSQKQRPGEVEIAEIPLKKAPTVSDDPNTRWPTLDLDHVPQIKRRLDIKAQSPDSDSSSSSDSGDETPGHAEKQRPGDVEIAEIPPKKAPIVSHDPNTRWPVLDLEHTTSVKKRLDIKAPSPDSDSSSSSDSEDEATRYIKKEEQVKTQIARPPSKVTPTVSDDPNTKWPTLDLDHVPQIKRRLDIKAPSPPPDSSSNWETVEEKIAQKKKHEQGDVHVSRLPFQEPDAGSHDPQRRQPESSSSSDSEDEATNYTKNKKKGEIHMEKLPIKASQTANDLKTQWPDLDLEHTTRVKRHLDIKAPSPDSDSSSSSDSEDETPGHSQKQRPGAVEIAEIPPKKAPIVSHDPNTRWPVLDLEHTTSVKKRLDIKVPSPDSDSSSSSDSEDEATRYIKKEEQVKTQIARPPSKVTPTISDDPNTRWPTLDLDHVPQIKRRLDIKAPSPPPDSSSNRETVESSSSSDSEDETPGHSQKQRPGDMEIAEIQLKKAQIVSHDPNTRWPILDLEHTTRVKKRLDIKAPSPDSDSSSSSDSEDEATKYIKKEEQVKTQIARPPSKVTPTVSDDPNTKWPTLDLDHVPQIKRRLDIKAPSPPPDSSSNRETVESSSSSDSEDETPGHSQKQRPGEVEIAEIQLKKAQIVSHDPNTRWPVLDLEHTTSVKKRLDIKAPSPDSDSSSSSDSEDEATKYIKKEEQVKTQIAGPPSKVTPTVSDDPNTKWPTLELDHVPQIKRCLDIKAPSTPPDSSSNRETVASSSSSDSEDETPGHSQKQRPGAVEIAEIQLKKAQIVSHDPNTRWPILDLEHTTRVKKRLDIKVPSPDSDSSSSSDSEDEATKYIKKEEQVKTQIARPPSKITPTVSDDPNTKWPTLDLDHVPQIKRRLDIKAPSTPPDSSSNRETVESSSSSDSEDETPGHSQKQRPGEVEIAEIQLKKAQIVSHDPNTRWPILDLEHTTSVKKRLDIKAPSPDSDSSSSSDSEDEATKYIKKEEQVKTQIARPPSKVTPTVSDDPNTKWPTLELDHVPQIKRRLDIKAPSPPPDSSSNRETVASSSSSDSEDETPGHSQKQRPGAVEIAEIQLKKAQIVSHDPNTRWPILDLEHTTRVKKRLDIKAPSPDSDSSSSSDSEDEAAPQKERERPEVVGIAGLLFRESKTVSQNPETRWPAADLGNITRLKRRLDIKAASPPPDSLVSSGSANHTVEEKKEEAMKTNPCYSSSSSDEQEEGMGDLSNKQTAVEPDSKWPELGLSSAPRVKRRMDIKARSLPPESSSSSDESDGGTTDPPVQTNIGVGVSSAMMNTSHSPKTDGFIKLEKYTIITDDAGDNNNITTTPELESQWASMNLGFSRFRKRLEITSHTHEPPNLPSSPPPDSPSSSSNESGTGSKIGRLRRKRREVGMQGVIHTGSSLTSENSLKGRDVNPGESNQDIALTITGTPHLRKHLDIKVREEAPATPPLRQLSGSSSSSNSENKMIGHGVPDLSLGVPRIKRRLNVKAPSPEQSTSSSSSSDSEKEVTDIDYSITYKRSIIRAPLPPSGSPNGQTIDHTNQRHIGAEITNSSHSVGVRNAFPAPRSVPSMSFDDVVKDRTEKSRSTMDVDLPAKIKWTGINRQLPDHSISSPRRHLNVGLSPQKAPPAPPNLPPPYSSNYSSSKNDDEIQQDRGKVDVTLMHKYSSHSVGSGSLASSRALDNFDSSLGSTNEILRSVSEDKRERKGLGALKAMSLERRQWDKGDNNFDKDASPLFDDQGPQGGTSFNHHTSEKELLVRQPLTQLHLSSTSVDERGATDLLYGIPYYRRHDHGEAPPPIPATPPPDEAAGLTWRAPQIINKQGLHSTRSHLQQSRNTGEPEQLSSQSMTVYFDSSDMNISDV